MLRITVEERILVSLHVEISYLVLKESPKSLFGEISGPREDPAFVILITCHI